MTSSYNYHLTSNFVASLALHVTFPESPTASKENLLDQECPNTLSLAYKNQEHRNEKIKTVSNRKGSDMKITRRIFNFLLDVWKRDQTWSFLFDI